MNLRVTAGLAIFLLAGCVTGGGPVRDANLQWTTLHSAALSGDVAAIRALLAGGADVNARGENGVTPLHQAVLSGDISAIRALLAGGADVNARGEDRVTPLHAAAAKKLVFDTLEADTKGGHDELSRVWSKAMGLDTLGEADREGLVEILKSGADDRAGTVRALLAGGANVNVRDKDGFTPLHGAAASGDAAAIRALLAGGADADARTKDGLTPLHGAVLSGDATTIHALLAGGADINARGETGATPLHMAAMKKLILAALEADAKGSRDKLLRTFGVAGFDALAETDREMFAAILKGSANDGAAVHALLAGGENVNARDDGRVTPLHVAALSGDTAAVKALLDAGGGPNAVAFGCGPVDVARRRMESTETSIAPFRDSIEALRAAGARPRKGCRL